MTILWHVLNKVLKQTGDGNLHVLEHFKKLSAMYSYTTVETILILSPNAH